MLARAKPVLIIQHAPHEHAAALRRAVETQGIETLWIHPYRGESYPSVDSVRGIISLGGPMSANDDEEHPWIARECELLGASVRRGLPTVGICLGGQMMARGLGAKVERNPHVEVGWYPVVLNAEGIADPVMGAAGPSPTLYHWHQDTFHLPPGAVLLGESQHCERQAYRIGEHAYGFQFHPEADHQLVLEWLSIDGVDDEIWEAQKAWGGEAVQDPNTQRNYALKGEKGSLKIAAAIGALFRSSLERTPEAPDGMLEQITHFMTHQTQLVLEFEGPRRHLTRLSGRIVSLLAIPAGEFIIFEEINTLLWPIRLGDIQALHLG